MLDNLQFKEFTLNSREETVTSIDITQKFLIKIQIKKNNKKENDLKKEFLIMQSLNNKNCVTCPVVYEFGTITNEAWHINVGDCVLRLKGFEYILQDYIQASGEPLIEDILLSMIEQKRLGIYQQDIKPDNLKFDEVSGICYIIDYDQAIRLQKEEVGLSNSEFFFEFCNLRDKKKYSFGNWLRHFSNIKMNMLKDIFADGRLDLSKTSLIKKQVTTNSPSGIYHTIDNYDVFSNGSRKLKERSVLLDKLSFKSGETVLDVGCNIGLLSSYLCKKGCSVIGVDNDDSVTKLAQIVNNISGDSAKFVRLDLDLVDSLPQFDTIMLFSVFHHTKKPIENAKKIVSSCSRIIIESRLIENGSQPLPDGSWEGTTRWNFNSPEDLINFYEKIFDGFKLKMNLGIADKNRHILEFIK